MTKRTRRRLQVEGSAPPHVPSAEPVGELLRCDLVTFGAANLHALSTAPDLVELIAPSWLVATRSAVGARWQPAPLDGSELTPF